MRFAYLMNFQYNVDNTVFSEVLHSTSEISSSRIQKPHVFLAIGAILGPVTHRKLNRLIGGRTQFETQNVWICRKLPHCFRDLVALIASEVASFTA